ncbi:MAG: hypothetical protein GY868_04780 [Deltaproteobacteria bacterium]|nr:hypothetical protein [Deltaproteobacteria bacterium]
MKKWVKHAERCRFENKYFTKLQRSPLQGMACRSGIAGLPEAAFSNPDKLIFHPQSRILKDSNTTTSAISEPETHSTGIHIKRYNVKKPWHALKYLVRKSRARRVWHTANSMQARDIPTPAPLFYLEKRTGGLLGPSYIVTEYIRNAVHLESFMADTFQSAGRIEKNHTIRLLAAAVQKMHARGIFHGDLKAKNILIQTPPDGRLQPCFVDLDAARVSGLLSAQQRCRDLARLNCSFLDTGQLSTTQRLRFLKYYLGRATHAELSSAWQLITSLSRRKLLKSGREFQK